MASCRALMTGTFQLVFWTDLMTLILDLETQFFEVLKTPRSTQLQVKCVLLKD